jgi:alanine dehydrogenase
VIGVPKEIKTNENRIALVPAGAEALVAAGPSGVHRNRAPASAAASRMRLRRPSGATIVPDAATAWGKAELLLKVKEPIASEWQYLRPDLTLFTYFHFAADEELTRRTWPAARRASRTRPWSCRRASCRC